ncbi:serine/threonine-protein kinase [Streptomyces sp. NPDC005349]|uniref:serine/threonine-protein kinase n=1 Tax=Streptomyces sp. NPDC005349 TaxID=3157037 RepID=UPI0033A4F82B
MGTVYRGWSEDGMTVAVKRVRADLTPKATAHRDREVEINTILAAENSTHRLNHVLVPLDHAVVDHALLIVMPMADESLAQAMKKGTLEESGAADTILQVAQGLEEIHNLGILHRDLKPANVLRIDDRWMIGDFGISRDLSQGTATHTFRRTGDIAYMAPERWNEQSASVRSDLYSLGVLAYEILAGRLPFQGPTAAEFRDQHLHQTPDFSLLEGKRLGILVCRLLEKRENGRPEDARSVVDKIREQHGPLTPAQQKLAEKLLEVEGRSEPDTASQLTQLRSQAFADLEVIVREARESASPLFNFTNAGSVSSKCWLTIPGGRVMFEVWDTAKGSFGEDVIMVGSVQLYKIAAENSTVPHGNIVCQGDENDWTWFLVQFQVASPALSDFYKLGPVDRPHGFTQTTFLSERPHLASTPIWRMTQERLTSDAVLRLICDLLDRF